jgi:hypothetical protein
MAEETVLSLFWIEVGPFAETFLTELLSGIARSSL